jgi:hypothetical protein
LFLYGTPRGLATADNTKCEVDNARRLLFEAALKHLDETRDNSPALAGVYDDLKQLYQHHLASLKCVTGAPDAHSPGQDTRYQDVFRDVLNVE